MKCILTSSIALLLPLQHHGERWTHYWPLAGLGGLRLGRNSVSPWDDLPPHLRLPQDVLENVDVFGANSMEWRQTASADCLHEVLRYLRKLYDAESTRYQFLRVALETRRAILLFDFESAHQASYTSGFA